MSSSAPTWGDRIPSNKLLQPHTSCVARCTFITARILAYFAEAMQAAPEVPELMAG